MVAYEDIEGYRIKVTLKDEEETYWMDFIVKEVTGQSQDKETKEWTIPLYGHSFEEDFEQAAETLHGFIKWDGCSHWSFEDKSVMLHLCGRQNAKKFSRIFETIFDLAEKHMTRYNKEIGDH